MLPAMRAALAMIALGLAVAAACSCGSKSKTEDGAYAADSPQHTFVQMQRALRAADADAVWALYSDSMREDLAGKISVLLDRADDVVERDLGRPKAELTGLPAIEVYRILIGKKALQDALHDQLPRIVKTVGDPEGTVVLHYQEMDGRVCTQPMERVGATWKVPAPPACTRNH